LYRAHVYFFFFQAEDGIRDDLVTGVQTCALPISHDVWKAMWFDGPSGRVFGIGVGTLVLLTNVILLGGYALGCHSLRHLVGGAFDRLSGKPVRKAAYDCVSCLNRGHMFWAWTTLFAAALPHLYLRLRSIRLISP